MSISKLIPINHLILLLGMIFLYFLICLLLLGQFPIFTDEAIYVRWAQIAANDASLRYISLIDGKQPLFIWLAMVPVKLFEDSLFAVRLLSLVYGLISIIGLYLLGRVFKNSFTGLITAGLFITSPFFFVYNRLALYESLISTIGVFSLLLIILLVKKPRLDIGIGLGFVIGLGLLTKSSANFFLYLMPFSLLLLFGQKGKIYVVKIIKLFFLFLTSSIIAYLMFNTLRLFPLFNMISDKNHTFILTNKEFLQNPFYLVFGNTPVLIQWSWEYLTPLVGVFFVASSGYYLYKRNYKIIYIFLWIITPFFATAFFGKIIYPRYLLYLFPAMFLIVAYFAADIYSGLKNKRLKITLLSVLFIGPLIGSMSIALNPSTSIIPRNDKNQLIDDWPAGGGISETVDIIKKQAQTQKVFVGTEGTFGLLPYALEIELVNNPNIEIKGYYPVKEVPLEVMEKAQTRKTYFIYNLTQDEALFNNQNITLVGKYPKGNSSVFLRLFEVK